jgi:hypothetical protein
VHPRCCCPSPSSGYVMSLEGRADTMVLSTGCYSSAVLPCAAQGTQRNPGGGHPLGVGWHGDTKSPQGALCWQCPPCSRTPRRSWGQALGPRLHLYTPLSTLSPASCWSQPAAPTHCTLGSFHTWGQLSIGGVQEAGVQLSSATHQWVS